MSGALFMSAMNSMSNSRSSSSSRRGGSISHGSSTCDGAYEEPVAQEVIDARERQNARKDALETYARNAMHNMSLPKYQAGQDDAIHYASFCALIVCIVAWFFTGILLLSGVLAAVAGCIMYAPPFFPRYFFAYDDRTLTWTCLNLETGAYTHQFFYNNGNEFEMKTI